MTTLTARNRSRAIASLTVSLLSVASAQAGAGDQGPPLIYATTLAPAPVVRPASARPSAIRWPSNPLRPRTTVPTQQTVWWMSAPAVPQPTTAAIPDAFLGAIRYQVDQARKGGGAVDEDELFARSAATLRALKGSAPTDAEAAEIRAIVSPAPSTAPPGLLLTPVSMHICDRRCRHR